MLSVRTLLPAALLVENAVAGLYPGITPNNHTCALADPILSCSCKANPDKVDTCCVETFGGLLLQTQFWTVYTGLEDEGQLLPKDNWGIHGLWPDFCNGSYTQYCDLSRQYDPHPSPNTTDGTPTGTPVPPYKGEPIDKFFKGYGKLDLLAYMNKFWVSLNERNWILWAHEYSKHATCFSTFQKECYGPKATKYGDMFDYFETTISYYRKLPTFKWLKDADIVPSNTTTYTLSDIQGALSDGFGKMPFIGCIGPKYNETEAGKGSMDAGKTDMNEVWYYYHAYGRPQNRDVQELAVDEASTFITSCAKAKGAIRYLERAKGSEFR